MPSSLSGLSNRRLLSIISSLHPRPREFEPFVLRGTEREGITACLWSPDTDIDALSAWTLGWQGGHELPSLIDILTFS